jgi:DNA (cytosine-5)-methyltransferase 1
VIYGSVCSGIEAATVAWHPLGWRPAFFSEIEKFPCAVLNHHYPTVPNHGDMTKFKEWPDANIDVLVGGTPCQSFSVAGLRKGLADPRGNLMLTYLAIADRYRPRWLVWENVPGVLSSGGGRDFGALLGGLAELGYGFAYRILDAQYFGLAQRRSRVFVVGCLGDWRGAAAVLFERHSLQGNPAPSRESGQRIAPTVESRAEDQHALGGAGLFVPDTIAVRTAQTSANGIGLSVNVAYTLDQAQGQAIAFGAQNSARQGASASVAPTLDKSKVPGVGYGMQVRRLTPRECERLQGFPDGYTAIPYRGKPSADGPRYKALGNSMAVPVMRWIGERIAAVEQLSIQAVSAA